MGGPELLRVELPVCPVCRTIGKQPGSTDGATVHWCVGPKRTTHKRERMENRRFVEVRVREEVAA